MIFCGCIMMIIAIFPQILSLLPIHRANLPVSLFAWIGGKIAQKLHPKKQVCLQTVDSLVSINLVISGLQAGASIPTILTALSYATNTDGYQHVANALLQGLPWEQAWKLAPINKTTEVLFQALALAWKNGVNPSNILKAGAHKLKETKLQQARESTEKLSVKLILPLGLCYLPAFILLGISPIIISGVGNF